jgi:hypothetical protein
MNLEDEELQEKAKVIAEATGRTVEAVIEDLKDDGIVNLSNEEKKDKNLVEQLKEAAELINTVQAISQEVSENTVLNGGENKTDIKVETTLEGDIVDKAIESLQNKADNIKKLIITLAPIFLLLTGGSMEAFGIIDVFGSDDSDYDDDDYYEVWGCTDPDAENYMPDATIDDGSCWWDDNNGGGGGPPHGNCDWTWQDNSYTNDDVPNSLFTSAIFSSFQCPHEMNGDFRVIIFKDGEMYDEEIDINMNFYESQELEHEFTDLQEGDYTIKLKFDTYDGSNWNWDSPRTYLIEETIECSAFLQNQQAYLVEDDEEQDSITITVDIAIPSEIGDACDSEQFELTWRLYSDNQMQYEEHSWEDGWISDNDRADFASFTLDNIEVGTYDPRIILKLNGDEVIDEKWLSYSITVESQEVYGCTDSEATNYNSSATQNDDSCEYEVEEECEVEIQNHYRGHVAEDEEQNAILVAFKVAPTNCEGKNIFIEIDLFQNGYAENYTYDTTVMGDSTTDISHIFDGVAIGNSWIPRITATVEGEQKEQVMFWGIDIVAQEPEVCEINLFWIGISTNATHASVGYDLDCGNESNDLEGYNVSVQFLVYEIGSSNNSSAQPIVYETNLHYIQGWVEDNHYLTLTNFTQSNSTHYDFYWYAVWEDGEGQQQFIEEMWLNRELNP